MPKRSSKERAEINQVAALVVDSVTDSKAGKNAAAVTLGRLGGLKGGPARAAKLSARKRSEIARRAAASRWAKKLWEQK